MVTGRAVRGVPMKREAETLMKTCVAGHKGALKVTVPLEVTIAAEKSSTVHDFRPPTRCKRRRRSAGYCTALIGT